MTCLLSALNLLPLAHRQPPERTMKFCIYIVICLLIASTVAQCGGFSTRANQIRQSRVRRLDEAEGQ